MCCPSPLKREWLQQDFHSNTHPTPLLSKTGASDTWCTADCSVYERGHDATYGRRVKIHTAPAAAAKNVLWLSVRTGIK